MSNDVTQWLAEIKALQQRLTELQQERDDAYTSAANWRRLYETEAQQRRTEATYAQQIKENLEEEKQRLQGFPELDWDEPEAESMVQREIESLVALEDLKQKLTEALLERMRLRSEVLRLAQVLQAEQESHVQTRKSLTTALGDAVDQLTKERSEKEKTE